MRQRGAATGAEFTASEFGRIVQSAAKYFT